MHSFERKRCARLQHSPKLKTWPIVSSNSFVAQRLSRRLLKFTNSARQAPMFKLSSYRERKLSASPMKRRGYSAITLCLRSARTTTQRWVTQGCYLKLNAERQPRITWTSSIYGSATYASTPSICFFQSHKRVQVRAELSCAISSKHRIGSALSLYRKITSTLRRYSSLATSRQTESSCKIIRWQFFVVPSGNFLRPQRQLRLHACLIDRGEYSFPATI